MIFITQLIYLKEKQEKIFDEFENVAIPVITKYNGSLMLRIRPAANTFIEAGIEKPYEVHIVSFPTEEDFQDFMKDEERVQYLHLKNQSIKSTLLIKGVKLNG